MIEFEDMQMMNVSDDALEALQSPLKYYGTQGEEYMWSRYLWMSTVEG